MTRRSLCPMSLMLAMLLIAPQIGASRFPIEEGFAPGEPTRIERQPAPGITHRFESRVDGPLTINTVLVDLKRPDLMIEAEKGDDRITGREVLTDMVVRLADPAARPIVAINADFWEGNSAPTGIFVDEGTIWKGPSRDESGERRRAFLAVDDQKNVMIGRPPVTMALRAADGSSLTIDGVNFRQNWHRTVVYTLPGARVMPAAPHTGWERVMLRLSAAEWLPNAPVAATVVDGELPLDSNAVVALDVRAGARPAWLVPGAAVSLEARIPGLPGRVVAAVGGGPMLVSGGRIVVEESAPLEGVGAAFVRDQHPRTAVGLHADGRLVFVVVDGRQPGLSVGINLPDLARLMVEMGCVEALNLDGGGSSTMTVGRELVTFPSDPGGARSVSNALVVRRTAPLGPPARVQVVPEATLIPAGARLRLAVRVTDAAGEELAWQPEWSATWSLDTPAGGGGARLATESGGRSAVFESSPTPGSRQLTVTLAGTEARGTATVATAAAQSVEFRPPVLLIEPGAAAPLQLVATATDPTQRFHPAFQAGSVDLPEGFAWDPATGLLQAPAAPGGGRVVARLGTQTATLRVAAATWNEHVVHSFDDPPAGDPAGWVTLANAAKGTAIHPDSSAPREGKGFWRLDYRMGGGGTTRIGVPLGVELPAEALGLGLWVRGDGQDQWLRGELRDSRGTRWVVDFTTAQRGISWKDEWRFLRVSLQKLNAMGRAAGPPAPPLVLDNIYLVQPQEAAKRDGSIGLDALTILTLPEE